MALDQQVHSWIEFIVEVGLDDFTLTKGVVCLTHVARPPAWTSNVTFNDSRKVANNVKSL